MPIYTARCRDDQCRHEQDYFQVVAKHDQSPPCNACDGPTKQIITTTFIQTDLPAYQSPIDGREVRGRKARREDLKRNGCRPYEGREVEEKEAARRRNYKQEKIEKAVDDQLERTITDLDASNRLDRVGDRSNDPFIPDDMRTY